MALTVVVAVPLLPGAAVAETAPATPAAPSSSAQQTEEFTSAPAYFAARLAEDEIFISDHLAGRYDRAELAAKLRSTVSELNVPFYVLVLPTRFHPPRDEELLAAVHDRLGAEGLYLLLDAEGPSVHANTYGVSVPADDAARAARFDDELTHESTPEETARRFVDVALSEDPAAIAEKTVAQWRAEQDRRQESEEGSFVDTFGPSWEEDASLRGAVIGFLSGTALTWLAFIAIWMRSSFAGRADLASPRRRLARPASSWPRR
ncbi:hypothetical protein GCM10022402_32050 [Salinactinospora qingdaonensis]|uniref:TPM domain-containing protein n=1 Tax=Salinactinospora qingdaonensis TaxID=702744 RepID=A0ABP7G015_9ACTN